jgi:tripartite-type tricarboxylate transporter receptor subunit TctC
MKRLIVALALCAAAETAHAQESYPSRAIKLVCGFPAGSSLDVITRIYADRFEKALHQPVVVENRVGHAGNIAADTVARSAPDGYTLVTNGVTMPIAMSLFKKKPFDLERDFTPVGMMGNIPLILAVSSSLEVNTVAHLIALAKSRPGELNHGSAGIGSIQHLSGELLNTMAGIKLNHIPYRGTNQVIVDFLAGRLQIMLAPAPTIRPYLTDSRVKLLAVTSGQRSVLYPDLPTIAESGLAGFDTSLWFGIWGPRGLPQSLVARLSRVMKQVPGTPEGRAQLAASGIEAVEMTPDQYASFVRDETKKYATLIEISGASAD